jgi:hypothetical protein
MTRQPRPQAQFETADGRVAEPAGCSGVSSGAAPRPNMNRQERVIFRVYVALLVLSVLFLAATGVLWWLEA